MQATARRRPKQLSKVLKDSPGSRARDEARRKNKPRNKPKTMHSLMKVMMERLHLGMSIS